MRVVLREDESGVSEVVGTILILAMTVVLFSSIIIWVTSIPTPSAQTRLDILGTMQPVYNAAGEEIAVNITLVHQGGEALDSSPTVLYITSQQGSNPARTDIVRLHTFNPNLNSPSGLLDGVNAIWNVGERWTYQNSSLRSTDIIQVTIVDLVKSSVLWAHELTAPAGTRPPVFIEKWADRLWETNAVDQVESGAGFFVFAKVVDPDGDLNPASVWAILTIWFGTGDPCSQPQQMRDDGQYPDRIASDGIFALGGISCMRTPWPSLQWDGSVILFNATDRQGHTTSSRLVLTVVPGPILDPGGGGGGTGRPQNLRWNGEQGYNVFNATQWDGFRFSASETRSFRASDEVVVVIASSLLDNIFDVNRFTLWDPFTVPAGAPPQAVVYGADKTVRTTTLPSSTQAFTYVDFVNGYNIYQYRFKMNDPATVGTNFRVSPLHPPNYFFGRYTLDVFLSSSAGKRFATTDSIDITDEDGYALDFPKIETFSDPGFAQPSSLFSSTSVAYVQVVMFTVDAALTNVIFSNIVVKDFAGGTQVLRAPMGGTGSNPPICPVTGACTGTAISIDGPRRAYRFAINLTLANQDPWLEGSQFYSLTVSSLRDTDEIFSNVAKQIVIEAPLYKLDVVYGMDAATSNAWGTKDYSYYGENLNGLDRWRKERIEFCGLSGSCKNAYHTISIVYTDFDRDGDLDTVSSIFVDNTNGAVVLHRRDLDTSGNIVFTRFPMANFASLWCNALAAADVTGDGWDDVVCGASNGHVWYYKNDGSWQGGAATKIDVDQSRTQAIKTVAIGDFNGDGANDIAVGGASGRLTWYPNLNKLGRFQNTGIVDDWFADGEQIFTGDISSGSYLNTLASDDTYEQVREASIVVGDPVTGGTTNPSFDSTTTPWTYSDWQNDADASGDRQSSGGNPNGYARLSTNCDDFTATAGYFYQSFTTSGTGPFSGQVSFDWRVVEWNAGTGGNVQLYVFVDTGSGNPVLGQEAWTSGPQTGTTAWAVVSNVNISSLIQTPGTYYLKIAFRTAYQNCASDSDSRAGFDNVLLNWSSTGSAVSEMEHYWRMTQLPLRAGTTFTFTLEARRSANTEGDDFVLAYATDVAGGDPRTGTYTTMLTVSGSSDTTYTFILPSSVAGLTLWIRAIDTDRTTGNGNRDILIVDQMYIRASTPSGVTGATLTNPGDSTAVNSIDADRQDTDIYWDLVVGTTGGRVFKYLGSSGGLLTPGACFYSTGGAGCPTGSAIVGVKFGNISGTQTGLEIVIAFGSTVRVLTGFGSLGNVILSALPGYSPSNAIQALGVGDVDGNGWDDVVVGTTTDVWFWSNRNHGISWTSAILVDNPGVNVYSLDLGDASKPEYRGR